MSATPPTPNSDFLGGQSCYLVRDYALDGVFAFVYCLLLEFVGRRSSCDLVAEGVQYFGPGTTVIDMIGAKMPLDVSVTVLDLSGGFPGVETTTVYTFGGSTTSVSVTLPDSDHSVIRIEAAKRFYQ